MSAVPSTVAMAAPAPRTITRCLYGTRPARRARGVVRCVLSDLGFSSETVADAELAVDELVTNACQHAPAPYELRIYLSAAEVKIAVMDGRPDHAALAALLAQTRTGVASGRETGRGLQLVTALFADALRCGTHVDLHGLACQADLD